MKIHWKIFTNTNNEDKTKALVARLVNKNKDEYSDLKIELYHKSGFVSHFTTPLASSKWSEVIVESLSKAQVVGRSWIVTGNIETELEAWSNDSSISGVENMQISIEKNA